MASFYLAWSEVIDGPICLLVNFFKRSSAVPRILCGCSFIMFCKTPNKNRRWAHHSLEICLCNNRVLVASLSIQNKAKKKNENSKFSQLWMCSCAYPHMKVTQLARVFITAVCITEGKVTSRQLWGCTGDRNAFWSSLTLLHPPSSQVH